MDVAGIEPVAAARDEDIGGDGTGEERFAMLEVVSQDGTGAGMNRDQARPAAFGVADRQNGVIEVYVTQLEVKRLGDA